MKRLFTEKEVREIIGRNEEDDKDTPDFSPFAFERNRLRKIQRAILEKMRGEGKGKKGKEL